MLRDALADKLMHMPLEFLRKDLLLDPAVSLLDGICIPSVDKMGNSGCTSIIPLMLRKHVHPAGDIVDSIGNW